MGRKYILQVICLQLKTLTINFSYAPPQTCQRTRVQEKESKGFSTMWVVETAVGIQAGIYFQGEKLQAELKRVL